MVVRGVDHEHFGVVTDEPDVVLDLEVLAVEREDPARRDVIDHEPITTTERSTSPRSMRWKASSTLVEPDRLGDETVQIEPALQVQVDQHRKVAGGQAVAVPAGLEPPAAPEELDHRKVDAHVRRRHPDLDERPGEIPGEERLLHHLRVADRLDADVGAVAAGEGPDRLDGVCVRRR